MKLVVLLACVALADAQSIVLHNLENVPISVTSVGKARIQSGTVKMFHPINLTSIRSTVEALLSIAKPEVASDTQLSYTLEVKIDELQRAFNSIKPKVSKRVRSKRWDQLGKAWKWIAGSPDADDLHALNKTITELVDENNSQVSINLAISNKIDQAIDSINSMMFMHQSQSKREQLDIGVVNMIMTIDTLKQHIDEIHEAISKARIKLIHQPLVSEEELANIVDILVAEGIEVTVDSEALQYVEAKVVTNDETLMYIITTPRLLETRYDIVRIIPLVHSNEKLHLPGEYYLTSKSQTQFIRSPLPVKSVYQLSELANVTTDNCTHNLIKGNPGSCSFQEVVQWDQVVEITSSLVLINNAEVYMENTCGSYNRQLIGHYLIEFSNCSVTIDGHQFSNTVITTKEVPLFPPVHTKAINRSLTPSVFNVRELSKLHLETRHKLDHLTLSHEQTNLTLWSASGVLFFITGLMFIIVIVLCRRSKDQFSVRHSTFDASFRKRTRFFSWKSSKKTEEANPKNTITVETAEYWDAEQNQQEDK